GDNDTTYVCFNNNGSVKFTGASLNNNQLTKQNVGDTNLNNSGCGTQKLCVNEPANCDPGSGSCNFFSARQKSGQNFGFALAGETDGYIAAVLSSDTTLGGSDTTYVCFNNNGNVKFTGASLNNNQLTKQNAQALSGQQPPLSEPMLLTVISRQRPVPNLATANTTASPNANHQQCHVIPANADSSSVYLRGCDGSRRTMRCLKIRVCCISTDIKLRNN
ncbi:hypothetical protein D4764_0267610, partial [Takifugu flavidus]